MKRQTARMFAVSMVALVPVSLAAEVERGARLWRACAACHSLEPGRHMTGPSLAGVWGRKAGTLAGFPRYSAALGNSGIVWNAATLEAWLADPERMVPGNFMLFQGLGDAQQRADVVAFLRAASEGKGPSAPRAAEFPDLKKAPAHSRVAAIRHCGDSYFVTNAKGDTLPFWEFNLRFKTDSSAKGPAPGKPVLVGQGMQGDRAQVVFAHPREISALVREGC